MADLPVHALPGANLFPAPVGSSVLDESSLGRAFDAEYLRQMEQRLAGKVFRMAPRTPEIRVYDEPRGFPVAMAVVSCMSVLLTAFGLLLAWWAR